MRATSRRARACRFPAVFVANHVRQFLRDAGPAGLTLDQLAWRLLRVLPPENAVLSNTTPLPYEHRAWMGARSMIRWRCRPRRMQMACVRYAREDGVLHLWIDDGDDRQDSDDLADGDDGGDDDDAMSGEEGA